ncbi:MAG: maleylpyruvate isomerase N-terminal domain-containing protein [Actinomycetales bacterium]|nr:maleylpyruvate isomerase N-terminal domain-containing protein [Actinomycetales bacterium]
MDYLDVIRSESARFAQVARSLDLAARVPAYPDWFGADLLYHLAEVQDFWSQMVLGATDTTSTTLARPAVDDLLSVFEAASARLVAALESADGKVRPGRGTRTTRASRSCCGGRRRRRSSTASTPSRRRGGRDPPAG